MPMPLMPHPGAGRKTRSLKQLVFDAGLLSVLALCIDPGDKNCWPGSGQLLSDTTAAGSYDFWLGATSSAGTDDPTFSGIVDARTASECFQYDGGDLFAAVNANDTFLSSLHKLGATYTVVAFFTHVSSVANVFFSTTNTSTSSGTGIFAYLSAGTNLNKISIVTGNGSAQLVRASSGTAIAGQVNMAGLARQIISNTNRNSLMYLNGTYELINDATSWTPSTAAGSNARIGAIGDNGIISGNTTKIHGLALFNRILTQAELNALRTACQKRWPTI